MVGREVTLGFDDLLQRSALVERDVTLACVSNEVGGDLVGNARWLGLPIAPLLARAGPRPGRRHGAVHQRRRLHLRDPAGGAAPTAATRCWRSAMNGEPLPVEHGFPVRMVVPGLYGYVSATKWVVDLEVTRFDRDEAYWTPRGWSAQAPIKTASRIDVPRDGAEVRAGHGRGRRRRLGAAPRHRRRRGPGRRRRLAAGAARPPCRRWTPGGSGSTTGTPRPAGTACRCGPPTAQAACRPASGTAGARRRHRLAHDRRRGALAAAAIRQGCGAELRI